MSAAVGQVRAIEAIAVDDEDRNRVSPLTVGALAALAVPEQLLEKDVLRGMDEPAAVRRDVYPATASELASIKQGTSDKELAGIPRL